MRGVHPVLKPIQFASVVLAALALAGCSSSPADEGKPKPGDGVALNPSGKPQSSDQAAYASQMQKTGDAMNAQRQKDADAMAAARQRSGGK